MLHVDAAILNLTESFCRGFQRLTGRTNVWLAAQLTNLSIIVYFVWAGMYLVTSGDAVVRIVLGVFCGGLLYVLAQTVLRVPIEAHENEAYRRVARGARNPRRIRDALLRIPFLTLSIALFYPILLIYINLRSPLAILSYSLIVLTTIVLYLLACDPLPPCAGKVKEWLGGTLPSRMRAAESPGGDRARRLAPQCFGSVQPCSTIVRQMSLARSNAASSLGHRSANMIVGPCRTIRCQRPSRSMMTHCAGRPAGSDRRHAVNLTLIRKGASPVVDGELQAY